MDGSGTVEKRMVTEAGRYGHGSWTVWSRKPDGMVTVSGQKRKIYCTFLLIYFLNKAGYLSTGNYMNVFEILSLIYISNSNRK